MQKLNFIFKLFILFALFIGCAKSSDEPPQVDLKVKEEEILLDAQSGTGALTIVWSNTEWELIIPAEGFLSGFNFLKGGSFKYSSQTSVQFYYTENIRALNGGFDIY